MLMGETSTYRDAAYLEMNYGYAVHKFVKLLQTNDAKKFIRIAAKIAYEPEG